MDRHESTHEELGLTHPAARVTARLGLVVWHLEGDIEGGIREMESAFTVLAGDEHDADLATARVAARPSAVLQRAGGGVDGAE